ncbi:transmembrane protein, putative [Bodo saltans]|uniref:Transmembrane protein, putative n=1 Tax=Bodo saltans TaxID=75058 RepID=A0A0S4JQC5_BODSA|nr:transmembrane protein, putative [Bodo saltans]|eukprot:CUG93724.1 transmembrane protein, putative [Bodo saltans]
MDTELLKAAVLHPGDEQPCGELPGEERPGDEHLDEQQCDQVDGTTSVTVHANQPTKKRSEPLNLVRNEEICRAVRSFQQISLPWSKKDCFGGCCYKHITNKIGRVKYIIVVAIAMIAPLEFNAYSFLLPFSSPLDPRAYFDGCYQYANASGQIAIPYLDCLACNNNIPYVDTAILKNEPNKILMLAIGNIIGLFAMLLAWWYCILATRTLSYHALLSFGVYTEVAPIFCDSKVKMLILGGIALYSALGAAASLSLSQAMEVLLDSLTVGDPVSGLCYQNATGISPKYFVTATFSNYNPAVTHINASTASVKTVIVTYAAAIVVYVPIMLSFYRILAHPYNSFDAGELFDNHSKDDSNGNQDCAGTTTSTTALTIAKMIQENIRFRIREEALLHAVPLVYTRWRRRNFKKLTFFQRHFPPFFLVYWASSNSPEDVAIVEAIVRLALKTETVPLKRQLRNFLS